MLYEIRNNSGARDIFFEGRKYFVGRNRTLQTRDSNLAIYAKTLPYINTREIEPRKKRVMRRIKRKVN